MNIVNVNSQIMPTHAMLSFCEELVSCIDDHCHHGDCLRVLSQELPIFLVNEQTFNKAEIEIDNENKDEGRPSTELLGYYTRSTNKFLANTPVIVLCPEKIRALAKTDDEFIIYFAKVLIHELAHAKMDYNNENAVYGYMDDFFKWMEEPMANYIVLKVFESYDRGHRHHTRHRNLQNTSLFSNTFDVVKKFIEKQPKNYAIAAKLFNKPLLHFYDIWRNHKDELGVNTKRQNAKTKWLDEIKNEARHSELRKIFDELV